LGGEWLEEKELSRFRKFIKPNTSKILVTIVIFIVLTIIVPYPVKITTYAMDYSGIDCYYPTNAYYSSTEKPMYVAIINNWHWQESFDIQEESIVITQNYDADVNYLFIYMPALIFIPYLVSCFLEEYYRQKSLRSN